MKTSDLPVNETIYVLGDSHVRSYSYSRHFIPLFIGPAAFNNFITEKASKHTKNKIISTAKLLSETDTLMLSFNGDVRHITRKTKGNSVAISELESAVVNYSKSLADISDNIECELIVCIPYPPVSDESNEDKYYKKYNKTLKEYLSKQNIKYIDVSEQTSDGGIINEKYNLDGNHVSYTIIPEIIKELNGIGFLQNADAKNEYPWNYHYVVDTDSYGPYKIWGDFSKEMLKLDKDETHVWDIYHQKTKLAENLLGVVNSFLSTLKIKKNCMISVIDAKEGMVPFLLARMNKETTILAYEFDDIALERSTYLNKISNIENVKIIKSENEYCDNLPSSNICVSFERYKWLNESKIRSFRNISKACEFFFFLSYGVKNDIRLLKKSGFKFVYQIPRGDNILINGNLLLASNSKLGKWYEIKLKYCASALKLLKLLERKIVKI